MGLSIDGLLNWLLFRLFVSVGSTKGVAVRDEALQWQAIIAVAYGSGLRREEILNLIGYSNITTTRKYYLMVCSEDISTASEVMEKILEGAKI